MNRYHINPETGNPNKCSAKPGNCPFKAEHYDTKEEARAAYENKQAGSLNMFARMEDMSREPLNEDLLPWVTDGPFGRFLNHPLVQDMMVDMMPGLANQRYLHNKKAAEDAYARGDWGRYVFIHERPFRAEKLYELHIDGIDVPKDLYEDVWIDSENIWQNQDEWNEMLVDLHERGATLGEPLDGLSDEVVIYRGSTRRNMNGLSWTLDEEKARWFAKRLLSDEDQAVVQRLVVPKSSILGYLTSRGESEILVNPDHAYNLFENAEEV